MYIFCNTFYASSDLCAKPGGFWSVSVVKMKFEAASQTHFHDKQLCFIAAPIAGAQSQIIIRPADPDYAVMNIFAGESKQIWSSLCVLLPLEASRVLSNYTSLPRFCVCPACPCRASGHRCCAMALIWRAGSGGGGGAVQRPTPLVHYNSHYHALLFPITVNQLKHPSPQGES